LAPQPGEAYCPAEFPLAQQSLFRTQGYSHTPALSHTLPVEVLVSWLQSASVLHETWGVRLQAQPSAEPQYWLQQSLGTAQSAPLLPE
jgi:hypothetical protein